MLEAKRKKFKSNDIARDRTTKVLSRFVEGLVAPDHAFQYLRDVLTSGSERNTKRFFERTCLQMFHIVYTAYDKLGQKERLEFFELLCSMYPVNMDKVMNHMKGLEIIAEAEEMAEEEEESEPEIDADVEMLGPNVMLVTPKVEKKPVVEIEPVAIKSKWAKTLHFREKGSLVTLCKQSMVNKNLRKKHDNLTICKRCAKYIQEVRKPKEGEKKEA